MSAPDAGRGTVEVSVPAKGDVAAEVSVGAE